MAASQREAARDESSGGLIERVRRLRRLRSADADPGSAGRVEALETRLVHLESAVEGLQDAVYRELVRHNEQIGELRRRTEPGEMARALSADARRRGI